MEDAAWRLQDVAQRQKEMVDTIASDPYLGAPLYDFASPARYMLDDDVECQHFAPGTAMTPAWSTRRLGRRNTHQPVWY